LLNLLLPWLKLSHALNAVRSPCAAQKVQNHRALRPQGRKRKTPLAIGCRQRKIWRQRADNQGFRAVRHLNFDCKGGVRSEQEPRPGGNQRRYGVPWHLQEGISLRSRHRSWAARLEGYEVISRFCNGERRLCPAKGQREDLQPGPKLTKEPTLTNPDGPRRPVHDFVMPQPGRRQPLSARPVCRDFPYGALVETVIAAIKLRCT